MLDNQIRSYHCVRSLKYRVSNKRIRDSNERIRDSNERVRDSNERVRDSNERIRDTVLRAGDPCFASHAPRRRVDTAHNRNGSTGCHYFRTLIHDLEYQLNILTRNGLITNVLQNLCFDRSEQDTGQSIRLIAGILYTLNTPKLSVSESQQSLLELVN